MTTSFNSENFDEYEILKQKDPLPDPVIWVCCLVCSSEFQSSEVIANIDNLCWVCPGCLIGHTFEHELQIIETPNSKGTAYDKK